MMDKRRHQRYQLDLIEINGTMSLTDRVEILDISLGGVAIKADRRLNIGKEYLFRLQEKGKNLEVRGIVVRSELSGIEQKQDDEQVAIYTAGVAFREESSGLIADFLGPLEQTKKTHLPAEADRRLHVRFDITTPREEILSYPAQFKVKSISLGGMLIQTEQPLAAKSMVPMGLSLNSGDEVCFIGCVVSCFKSPDPALSHYEIGVAFTDLTSQGQALLKAFIDYMAAQEQQSSGDARNNQAPR